jgi:hypothetical protein
MSDHIETSLTAKRLVRSSMQVTKPEELISGMAYRLFLPEAVVLFFFQSMIGDKGLARIQITSIKGSADLQVAITDIPLTYLGLMPVKTAGVDAWFPHWIEVAADALNTSTDWSKLTSRYSGGLLECLGDSYLQADIKGMNLSSKKFTCENWRYWAPEFGRWYPMTNGMSAEFSFTETILYPEGRILVKCENFWAILNPKRT